MSEIGSLIEKLNPQCKEVLEKAAQNCVRQTHFNVELEHFVLELLEAEDSDIIPILDSLILTIVIRYWLSEMLLKGLKEVMGELLLCPLI